jgi:hypothetical protein
VLIDELVGKTLPHLIVFEDVSFHIDMVLCIFYSVEHRLKRYRAIHQQSHLIANDQRCADNGRFHGHMVVEYIGLFAMVLESIENFLALLGRKQAVTALELNRPTRPHGHVGYQGRQYTASNH